MSATKGDRVPQHGTLGPEDGSLWEKAQRVIPWATQTNAKRRPADMAGVMPGFFRRGKGCFLWDSDGRQYLDFECALGPIILGYQYPDVDRAVRQELDEGVLFSMASPREIEVAERLQSMIPCADRVRFLKTGDTFGHHYSHPDVPFNVPGLEFTA